MDRFYTAAEFHNQLSDYQFLRNNPDSRSKIANLACFYNDINLITAQEYLREEKYMASSSYMSQLNIFIIYIYTSFKLCKEHYLLGFNTV